MQNLDVTIWIVGAISGILSAIVTYIASRKNSETESLPSLINAITDRALQQEGRLTQLEQKQSELEKDIKKWKGNYFQLLKWLQGFFDEHGIKDKIPQFHKRKTTNENT